MPELPEVETIRKGVNEKLIGKKIKTVEIKVPKLFIGPEGAPIGGEKIIGAKIIGAERVAKVLIINLDNNYSIIVHLKMSGQLIYQSQTNSKQLKGGHSQKVYDQPVPHAYTHITYEFTDGSHLYFNDYRKFGWNRIVKTSEIAKILGPDKYGPEPATSKFSAEYLKKIFSRSNKAIKLVLMDQAKISGIGNIYANDGLWYAKVLPTRPAKSLTDEEISRLKSAIEKVIKLGLKYGGSSENTYVNIDGQKGKYMEISAVYQKKQDPKGHPVKRIAIGGRGTFFCEICQK